jgi:hypothetical protein
MTQRHRHSIFLPEDNWLWVTKHWTWQLNLLTSPYLELNWSSWWEAWGFYNKNRQLQCYKEGRKLKDCGSHSSAAEIQVASDVALWHRVRGSSHFVVSQCLHLKVQSVD